VNPLDYPFWLASRSAGVVAYLLLSGSVILGLAMATRLTTGRDVRVLHERIALLALGAVAAHGLLLLPDGWLQPKLYEVLIPFTTGYRPLWTGLGILAAWRRRRSARPTPRPSGRLSASRSPRRA
jgi:sulfoxide reductase heme-binding subunit YedZ